MKGHIISVCAKVFPHEEKFSDYSVHRIVQTEVWEETIATLEDATGVILNSIRQVCVPFQV